MDGIKTRKEFEDLLLSLGGSGDDPILFMRENVAARHISGNHRFEIKENYKRDYPDLYEVQPFWYLTLTHFFLGLRPDQTR